MISLVSIRSCSLKEFELEKTSTDFKLKLSAQESEFETELNEKGEEVARQSQLLASERQLKSAAIEELENFKKVNSHTRVTTVTKIKKVYVPMETVSAREIDFTGLDSTEVGDSIKIFRVLDEWYGVSGKVLNSGILFDSITFKNELVTTIGWQKEKGLKNLFKKPNPVVEVVNKNPYSKIVKMNNIIVEPRKKRFYETTGFKIGLGVVGGIYLSQKVLK
jgi:hypothetical protein